MKRKLLFLLLLSNVIAWSCKKGDSAASRCALSVTSIVGTYRHTGYTVQQTASSAVVNEFATWAECEKDDVALIRADGTYQRTDAGITCTNPPDVFNGTWALNGNIFTSNNSSIQWEVITFDCNTLIVSSTTYPKMTETYIKQ